LQDAQINRQGAPSLGNLPPLEKISPRELQALIAEGVFALDVRANAEFVEAHVPGSVNIALSGQFASWAGIVLGLSARPVLIADTEEQYSEARLRLARVGIEDPRGYLEGGIAVWKQAGLALAETLQITAQELQAKIQTGQMQVLDVRREPEWQSGHIAGATWWPLDNFKVAAPEIDAAVPLAVHCKGGYRSVTACSLLERAGLQNVVNIIGGFDAWQQTGLPVEVAEPEVQNK